MIKVGALARTCRPPTCFAIRLVQATPLGVWAVGCVRCKVPTLAAPAIATHPTAFNQLYQARILTCVVILGRAFIPEIQ